MDQLKIGVLTFHSCINYGSYWQAKCLVEGLIARGHNAEILNHESRPINLAEWKCAYQPVLPTEVPASDHPLYRKKIEGFFEAFESLPLSPRFALNDPAQMQVYDIIVVGSDEVWNLSHPWYGRCAIFYGDGLKADCLVSYAASFGNYNASNGLERIWADKLRNFDSISVRDENSQLIVEEAIGVKPPLVLDPCLQFSIVPEPRKMDWLKEPYAAVYGHNFSAYFIEQIKSWAAARSLPLISIGYRNDWADKQWITADPHEFAHFIAGTAALITNFFHGCVFALRNVKPFVCETSPYRGNKLQGLMVKTGSENHLVNSSTPADVYAGCLNEPLSKDIIEKIEQLRKSSNIFLDQSLAVNKVKLIR